MLKLKDTSSTVATIQEWLSFLGYKYKKPDGKMETLKADGEFGLKTEAVVLDFQKSMGLYADGIVGPTTMAALKKAYLGRVAELNSVDLEPNPSVLAEQYKLERVYADAFEGGYGYLSLRNDAAEAYRQIREKVLRSGGILTSSGGMRDLNAKVTASRSPVSFHYLGLALDLFIYSGMVNPAKDPYVVQREGNTSFHRVFARCSRKWEVNGHDKPAEIILPPKIKIDNIITYNQKDPKKNPVVEDHFLDLTALFMEHGFSRIKARKDFYSSTSMMAAEWWHFQFEKNLVDKVSSFGDELLKIYTINQVRNTPPWKEKDRVFGTNWY